MTQIRLHKRFLLILLSFWPNWPPFALSLFDRTIAEWYWQKPKSSTILNKSYTMRSCWGKKVFSSLEATFESSLGHNFLRSQWHTTALHSDAFFRSQRDINRHGNWLDFWKIQVNLVNFISGTFGTAWDKYSKNGLTFGCLEEKKGWNFDLEIIFFKQKQDFGIFI